MPSVEVNIPIIVIAGPTASGKSGLALALAEKLNSERRTTVGFALMVLQRRLASSPEAIYQSLYRRRERLEDRLKEERYGQGIWKKSARTF